MALFDDILSGGNWVTGLAIGVGAMIILPLAAPVLRPLAKAGIKGGILAYQGAAELIEGIGDLVAEAVAARIAVARLIGDPAVCGVAVGAFEIGAFPPPSDSILRNRCTTGSDCRQ